MDGQVVAGVYGIRQPRLPRRGRLRFRPATTATPPPGTYDPQVDAQVRGANRGFQDLGQDIERQNERGVTDYGLSRQQIVTNRNRRFQDMGVQATRFGQDAQIARSDLQRSLTNALGDIQTNRGNQLSDLSRNYAALARRQQDALEARGLAVGGAPEAAAQARAGNEGYAAGRINAAADTAAQRTRETGFRNLVGQALREQRFGQDQTLARHRVGLDSNLQLGRLDLTTQRQRQDRRTQLSRAGRENKLFGLDASATRWYQAAGVGMKQPPVPGYERTSPSGTIYRVLDTKQGRFYVTPDGRPSRRRPR